MHNGVANSRHYQEIRNVVPCWGPGEYEVVWEGLSLKVMVLQIEGKEEIIPSRGLQ